MCRGSGWNVGGVHWDKRIFTLANTAYHGFLYTTGNNDAADKRQTESEKGPNETDKVKQRQGTTVVRFGFSAYIAGSAFCAIVSHFFQPLALGYFDFHAVKYTTNGPILAIVIFCKFPLAVGATI